ncbi:uncharacterized protein LOC144446193 [Glandiceps talaboti]
MVSALLSICGLTMFVKASHRSLLAEYRITEKFVVTILGLFVFNAQNLILGVFSTVVIVNCDLRADNKYYLRFSLSKFLSSHEDAVAADYIQTKAVTPFFSTFGHLLLIVEMFCIFLWARCVYRKKESNVESLLLTDLIGEDGDGSSSNLTEGAGEVAPYGSLEMAKTE